MVVVLILPSPLLPLDAMLLCLQKKAWIFVGSNIELGEGDFFLQSRCVGLCTLWEKHSLVVCLGL